MVSRELGIDLASGRERELFRWLLVCLLFGKPIQRGVAERAYRELVEAGLDTPEAILAAGWDRLVEILDRGHYVRFDFSTATKLLEVCHALRESYGSVTALLGQATGRADLARRLQAFKGVGPTTTRVFLGDIMRMLPSGPAAARRRAGMSRRHPAGPGRLHTRRLRVGRPSRGG